MLSEATFSSTKYGFVPFSGRTTNDGKYRCSSRAFHAAEVNRPGLLNICEHNTHCGLAVFPLAFVESVSLRHQIDQLRKLRCCMFQETWTPPPLLKPCVKNVTEEYVDKVFRRTFLWHSRVDSNVYCPTQSTGVEWAVKKVARALPLNLVTRTGRILEGAE